MEDKKHVSAEAAIASALELMNDGVAPLDSNRFDKLVQIRDTAQALIVAERSKENERIKRHVDTLAKELAEGKARLASLQAMGAKPRAKRSDAGKPRSKPDSRSVAAISRGEPSLAQVS